MVRSISTMSLAVSSAALYGTFPVLRWLNRIPNSTASAEIWEQRFTVICISLGVLALGIALVRRSSKSNSFHLALSVMIGAVIVMLFPIIGWGLAFYFYSSILVLPMAFFGAAVLRSAIDAWRGKGEARSIAVASGLSALGFTACLYSALFFDKAMALGGAASTETG